jgi:hypothetical protein
MRVGNGWTATVALKLERRHTFPEVNVADRSCADWAEIFKSLPTVRRGAETTVGVLDDGNIRYHLSRPASLVSRICCTFAGTPQRRSFEQSHKLRHRDLPAELILGYATHRTASLIDATALIMPVIDS